MVIHVYLVVCLCGLLSSPAFGNHSDSTSAPPGYCRIRGELYEEGAEIYRDTNNCGGSICLDGYEAYWDDACAFSWPECDGIQEKVDGQCCPVCMKTTTPRMMTTVTTPPTSTLLKPGQCYSFGEIFDDGATIEKDPYNCYGAICEDGDVLYWDHGCAFSTAFCAGTQIRIPGQCCPECIRAETSPSPTSLPEGCLVNGIHYDVGQEIPDEDPCMFCTCTRDEGVMCAMMACAWTPCLNPVLKKGDCCPTCQEGCVKDGVHYEIGDKVPTPDPCEFCECSPSGEIECALMMCDIPECANIEYHPDQCCPVCPEGCFVDGVHYDYGVDVLTPNPCEFCTCTPGGIMCAMVGCARPPCDNPETPPGQCCPVCPDGCSANGVQYEHGDIIPTPDPCEYCECTADAGIVCAMMDCAAPPCANPERVPGQCCPVCPEGCVVDGIHYDYGQVIPSNERCERCVCEALGPVCGPVTCPPVNCINPQLKKGECCPVCPKGPNCAFGRRLIPVGEVYSPKPRITCSCRTDPWEPMASCRKSMGAKYAARLLKRKSSILNPILLQILQLNAKP